MVNKVILAGRLTKDPELRSTGGGASVCSFTLAVDRKYVPKGEERQADFPVCVAWRNTAEFISKYFEKGQLIAVEGSLQTRSWDDNDGNRRYATEVVVSDAGFVGNKSESAPRTEAAEDEDVPF